MNVRSYSNYFMKSCVLLLFLIFIIDKLLQYFISYKKYHLFMRLTVIFSILIYIFCNGNMLLELKFCKKNQLNIYFIFQQEETLKKILHKKYFSIFIRCHKYLLFIILLLFFFSLFLS